MSAQRATRTRGQLVATIAIVAAVVAGGVYVEGTGPAAVPEPVAAVGRPSGAWFCPHGGGRGWQVTLELANPGTDPVDVRVTHLSGGRPARGGLLSVPPGSQVQVPFRANDRDSGSMVEFFDGWVAAGWVAHAGGTEAGVAAEPCLDQAARRWYLPDGVTLRDDDAWVIVMNPFASPAVVSLSYLTTGRGQITTADLTNVPIGPYRVRTFHVNADAEGEPAVGTLVDVPGGRVAIASLGLSVEGAARSSVGQIDAGGRAILPAAADQGRSDVLVMNPRDDDADVAGSVLDRETSQALEIVLNAIVEAPPEARSAAAFSLTTQGSATLDLALPEGVAAARRTFGVVSDQGSTVAASAPHPAWVLLPAVAGRPSKPGLVLANPGDEPAKVTLSFLTSGSTAGLTAGTERAPAPIQVSVPAGRSVSAPREFLALEPRSSVLALASSGTFVPAFASYSLGREGVAAFAVSLGIPVPTAWVPTQP